jgi:hypothetical protein
MQIPLRIGCSLGTDFRENNPILLSSYDSSGKHSLFKNFQPFLEKIQYLFTFLLPSSPFPPPFLSLLCLPLPFSHIPSLLASLFWFLFSFKIYLPDVGQCFSVEQFNVPFLFLWNCFLIVKPVLLSVSGNIWLVLPASAVLSSVSLPQLAYSRGEGAGRGMH